MIEKPSRYRWLIGRRAIAILDEEGWDPDPNRVWKLVHRATHDLGLSKDRAHDVLSHLGETPVDALPRLRIWLERVHLPWRWSSIHEQLVQDKVEDWWEWHCEILETEMEEKTKTALDILREQTIDPEVAERCRQQAIGDYMDCSDDNIVIEADAEVELTDDGEFAWVAAWVFVDVPRAKNDTDVSDKKEPRE